MAPIGSAIVRQLGAGSSFEVALVRLLDGKVCVCKRPRRQLAPNLDLKREHRALERLAATNRAPAVLAWGTDAAGDFLIQSLADGISLRALADGFAAHEQQLPGALLCALWEALLMAQDALPRDFVHGDLGPDHVFVRKAEGGIDVTFIDFGLSFWRDMPAALRPLVGARGTLPYLAPEVARGEAHDDLSERFALAATMCFVVLGRDPCRATEVSARLVEMAERGFLSELLEPCGLPPSLHESLLAALRFAPAERVVDPAVLLRLLRS